MAKVVAIVLNSVSHDVRVLKEAESLLNTGHDVSIVGINDARTSDAFELLGSGVKVFRVPWKAESARPKAIGTAISLVLPVLLLLVLVALPLGAPSASLQDLGIVAEVQRFVQGHPIEATVRLMLFGFASFLLWRTCKRYRARMATYRNVRRQEIEGQLRTLNSPINFGNKKRSRWLSIFPQTNRLLPRPLWALLKSKTPTEMLTKVGNLQARERLIADFVIKLAPEIVHCHDITALPIGALVKKSVNCKLVFDAHEIYDQLAQAAPEESQYNKHTAKLFSAIVDRFITINDSIAEYYRNVYPELPPATVIRNAVKKADLFEYDGRLHEAANLPRDAKILLYQGGYAPRRGLIALVQAAQLLPEGWYLVMMGWGRIEGDLRRVAQGLGSNSNKSMLSRYAFTTQECARVRFIPPAPQKELTLWTAGATIGVIPYENQGLNHWFCTPNKLWEYPNAGVPILASPFPEMRKVIEAYEIGWLLPLDLTPEGIANSLSQITDETIATAHANCLGFVEDDNWSVYGRKLVALYDDLV